MVELQGTDNQVKYAGDLRASFVSRIDAAILGAGKLVTSKSLELGDLQLLVNLQAGSLDTAFRVAGIQKALSNEQCMTILRNTKKWAEQQQTRWWIENGSFTVDFIITMFCKKYVKVNG